MLILPNCHEQRMILDSIPAWETIPKGRAQCVHMDLGLSTDRKRHNRGLS